MQLRRIGAEGESRLEDYGLICKMKKEMVRTGRSSTSHDARI